MDKFKGTLGPWKIAKGGPENGGGMFSIDSRDGWNIASAWNVEDEDQANLNARLIASAPDMLNQLIEAKLTIQRLKLSMLAHPDCTEGSEFDDYTSTAQEVEDSIEVVINKALGKEVSNG